MIPWRSAPSPLVPAPTIRPPFEECANAAMERSNSLSPTLMGRTSTPSEEARPGECNESLKERHLLHARSDLFEKLQPFRADAVFVQHKTSSVGARPGEGLHETSADRIGDL